MRSKSYSMTLLKYRKQSTLVCITKAYSTWASFCENMAICLLLLSASNPSVRDLGPFFCQAVCRSGVYELGFRGYVFKPYF